MRRREEPYYSFYKNPPEEFECREQPMSFWKAKPAYGMTPHLIDNSVGDLWMVSIRDMFTNLCISGHIGLMMMCSQHYLAKAGEQEGDEQMATLNHFFHHMYMIRGLVLQGHMRQCLPASSFPIYPNEIAEYVQRWVGQPGSNGEGFNPQIATMNGQVDPYQMFYTHEAKTTPRDRMLKKNLPKKNFGDF